MDAHPQQQSLFMTRLPREIRDAIYFEVRPRCTRAIPFDILLTQYHDRCGVLTGCGSTSSVTQIQEAQTPEATNRVKCTTVTCHV